MISRWKTNSIRQTFFHLLNNSKNYNHNKVHLILINMFIFQYIFTWQNWFYLIKFLFKINERTLIVDQSKFAPTPINNEKKMNDHIEYIH